MTNLSEREWTVLTALWDSGGAALGDLTEALRPETGWSRNTVLTYLTRMEAEKHPYRQGLGARAGIEY